VLGLYVIAEQLRSDVGHVLALFADATAAAHDGGYTDALQVGHEHAVAHAVDVYGHVSAVQPAGRMQVVDHHVRRPDAA